jgi:hypothetical protein
MGQSSTNVPPWVVSAIVCLLLSVAGTYMTMLVLGFKTGESVHDIMAEAMAGRGKGGGGGAPGNGKLGAFENDGRVGGMDAGLRDPRPVDQLVTLVEKLDGLTLNHATLELTVPQSEKVLLQLQKLDEPPYMGDKIARELLDSVLDALKDQRQKLEAAGVKWPKAIYDPNVAPPPNPFKEGEPAKHLKALRDHLAKAA